MDLGVRTGVIEADFDKNGHPHRTGRFEVVRAEISGKRIQLACYLQDDGPGSVTATRSISIEADALPALIDHLKGVQAALDAREGGQHG